MDGVAELIFDGSGRLVEVKFNGLHGEACKIAMTALIARLREAGINVNVKQFIPEQVEAIASKVREEAKNDGDHDR